MKKMFKRTAAMAISAFMAAQYIPFSVIAHDADKNDLYICPYVISESNYNAAKTANYATGKQADVTTANTYGSQAALTFNVYSYNETTGETALVGTQSSTAYVDDTDPGTPATFLNLPDGKYKIVPTSNDTDALYKDAEAFYIQLPATSRDVYIYPKFTDNQDNNDTNDPTETPGTDPQSDNKHCIKLTKTLSDTPTTHDWTTTAGRAGFNAYFKNQLGKWEKVMNGANAKVYYTDTNGEVIIDGLPLGEYCLVEVDAPDGYLLNSKPVTFSLKGGSGVDGNKQTDSMVNDKGLTVKKDVAYDNGNGYGQTYNWTITADIPSQPANLLSYNVIDNYTNLKDGTVSITSVVATDGTTPVTLDAAASGSDNDYTIATDATTDTVTVSLTADGIAKLAGKTRLEISVSSVLKDNYDNSTDDVVKNEASISYQYAYDPGTNDPTDIPDPDPDNTTNPYPAPINYPDPADPNPDPDTVASFTPRTITISNIASDTNAELTGSFDISSFSEHTDDVSAKDAVAGDNKLTLENLAPGKYTITQKSTAAGYSIANPDSKTIFIAENGNVYEGIDATGTPITAETDGTYIITFVNNPVTSGFNLPFTGTTATIVFSITGILLMAGTAFFIFIILKKRDDDEEEQENN